MRSTPRRPSRTRWLRLIAIALVAWTVLARAEHPLLTEDPGTQGHGGVELELGASAARGDPATGGRAEELAAQLSYGLGSNLDVIVRGTWLSQAPATGPAVRDIGDTTLDLKWGFEGTGPVAFAIRGGVDLPTGNAGKGLGTDAAGFHMVGVAGGPYQRVDWSANVGYARVRQAGTRNDQFSVTAAILGPRDAALRTFVEASAATGTDPADGRWPAVARTGLLYTVRPGVAVDVGYALRLNTSAPRHTVLAGLTLRW